MKAINRFLALVVMVLMVATLIIPVAAQADPVTLNFWYWDNSMEDQYKLMIADFEAKNPDIKIQYSVIPWADYWTKLQTALPTGEGPDVMWMNHPNAQTYMPTGNLMSIADMNLDMSHFSPNLYAPFTLEGDLYGVPIFFDTIAMFYNKTLFDAAGVEYPTADWTWDDMREAAAKLTVMDGDEVIQYGLSFPVGNQGGSSDFIMQNQGEIFTADKMALNFENPNSKEAIQFMMDLMYKDRSAMTPTEFAQLNSQGELFVNGMVAIDWNGLWRVQTYHDALGDQMAIAPLPTGKVKACTFHNLAYVASAKTKYPEAVAAFMAYTTTKEAGDFVAPVFLPAYDESQPTWFETFPDLDLKVFADAVDYAFPLAISAKNAGPVFSAYEDACQRLFANAEATDELLKAADDAVNAEINK